MAVTEAAAEVEDLTLGGVKGLLEGLDVLAVASLELSELGGERADDAAGVVIRWCDRSRGQGVLLLGAELLDAASDRGAAVEEV